MARILVAEDSETELAYFLEVTKHTPHQFTSAKDGREAEATAKNGRFDLVILDVIMPEKNGFQVCRSLKQDPDNQKTPIMLLTSKSELSDQFWGKKQGADAYITKPFDPAELLQEIEKLLGRH